MFDEMSVDKKEKGIYLFHQTFIAILTSPEETSTFIINSSNFGVFCFFNFSFYCSLFTHIYEDNKNKFPDFFCMGTFIDSIHMKL